MMTIKRSLEIEVATAAELVEALELIRGDPQFSLCLAAIARKTTSPGRAGVRAEVISYPEVERSEYSFLIFS